MTLFQAVIFGIVQGLTEFLPVSSSGHLYLIQTIMGTNEDIGFFIWLHVGTLAAVMVYYRKSLLELITHPKSKKLLYLLVASLPTFVIAVLFKLLMPTEIEKYLLPLGFLGTFILLLLSNPSKKAPLPLNSLGIHGALTVGTVQGLAVIPGLSRSGSTITALTKIGVNRDDAAEFSFLLSIPVILGGAGGDLLELITANSLTVTLGSDLYVKLVAVVISAISGLMSLSIVEGFLKKGTFRSFAYYLPIPLLLSILLL